MSGWARVPACRRDRGAAWRRCAAHRGLLDVAPVTSGRCQRRSRRLLGAAGAAAAAAAGAATAGAAAGLVAACAPPGNCALLVSPVPVHEIEPESLL